MLHATDILQNWYLHVFKHIYYLNWFVQDNFVKKGHRMNKHKFVCPEDKSKDNERHLGSMQDSRKKH